MLERPFIDNPELINLSVDDRIDYLWSQALERTTIYDNVRVAPGISGDISQVKFRGALPGEFIIEDGYRVSLPEGVSVSRAAGKFALELFERKSEKVAAVLGFDLKAIAGRLIMNIEQTPQGCPQDPDLPKATQRRIRSVLSADFRTKLLNTAIELARSLGIHMVYATPSSKHRNVVSGRLSPDNGAKMIDKPLKKVGFKGGTGNVPFYYEL